MTAQIEVGQHVLINEEETTVVEVKGRWVKLADGRNVSRLVAAEGALMYADEHDDPELDDEPEEETGTMSETLAKYRATYVPTVNYSGAKSVDNGDKVAELLRGLSPDETCAVADHLFGEMAGTHWEKYQSLNKGQRRMNAGNRIRALIKRGEKTVEDLAAAIKGDDLIDDSDDGAPGYFEELDGPEGDQ
jgi:hypothetical protein